MNFTKGQLYTHRNMLDVAFNVIIVLWESDKGVTLKVRWYNKAGWDMNIVEVIFIKADQYKHWYKWDQNLCG